MTIERTIPPGAEEAIRTPESGEVLTPTDANEVGTRPTRTRARTKAKQLGKAGPAKRGRTAAKKKPGIKVPKQSGKAKKGAAAGGQTSGTGRVKRETFKTKTVSGRSPKASQKRTPPKAAAATKRAKTRTTSAGVVSGRTTTGARRTGGRTKGSTAGRR